MVTNLSFSSCIGCYHDNWFKKSRKFAKTKLFEQPKHEIDNLKENCDCIRKKSEGIQLTGSKISIKSFSTSFSFDKTFLIAISLWSSSLNKFFFKMGQKYLDFFFIFGFSCFC